jgi:general nucleoside transport system permease protein
MTAFSVDSASLNTLAPPSKPAPSNEQPPSPNAARDGSPRVGTIARWMGAIGIPLLMFGLLGALKGVSPIAMYTDMAASLFTQTSLAEILVKVTPVLFAALAVAVPARAGLVNVGGEGQLVIGAVAAFGITLVLGDSIPGPFVIVAMVITAAIGGALWAGIAALLRQFVGINEAVTSLLLNYIAIDVMSYLVYDRWKDRQGSGQPVSRALPADERLPRIAYDRVHFGLVLAVGAFVVVALVFRYTTIGFRLRVIGGNPEAARRAGYEVAKLTIGALCVGGALAGIGGMTQLAGVEYKLRQGLVVQLGYIGYLASWLARHRPTPLLASAMLLSAVAIGGDSLQIDSSLPAASVNILMALLLLGVFGFGRRRKGETT